MGLFNRMEPQQPEQLTKHFDIPTSHMVIDFDPDADTITTYFPAGAACRAIQAGALNEPEFEEVATSIAAGLRAMLAVAKKVNDEMV